jgi:hypothetical protein
MIELRQKGLGFFDLGKRALGNGNIVFNYVTHRTEETLEEVKTLMQYPL